LNYKSLIILIILPFMVSGCASIMSGTSQDIAMHTNPEGADCIMTREGKMLRKVVTPDNVRVSKLKYDIDVKCSMDGFYDSTAHVNSGTQGSVFGNILAGGVIGWAVDSSSGADNKYADVVTVTMVPLTQVAPKSVKIGADGKVIKEGEGKSAEKTKVQEVTDLHGETKSISTQSPNESGTEEVKANNDPVQETSPDVENVNSQNGQTKELPEKSEEN